MPIPGPNDRAPLNDGGNPAPSGAQNQQPGPGERSPWLKYAQDAYSRSTNYFDTNYRKRWEDDLRMFQSKHPRDSKYNAEAYRYRSRIFRPKSRSVSRKNEATAALAFFSNPDVVSIEPVSESNMENIASADVMQALLQYRLTKTIPWFLTVIGGFQDTINVGLVCSMQTWDFQQKMVKTTVKGEMPAPVDPLTGLPAAEPLSVEVEIDEPKIIRDEPRVDLIAIENIRFDPAAHWYDVVKTSPYLIVQMPMYVNDVLDRMDTEGDYAGANPSGKWKKLSKDVILNARVEGMDPLRQARNDNREQADAVVSEINEFDVVMVHLNFITIGHETHVYYTLKDTHMLSDPMLVQDMFLHCKDGTPPVVIGFCIIETHKPVPSSLIGLGGDLQRETNEIANQRLDNVKFVLNKRQYVRRGANVDVESLLRNVPGGVTMVNDVEKDVREVNWQDVTSSSYQEQDRVNVDYDELAGNFAQGSVLTNRKLNETVGGMRMMAQGANMITEYGIRVFVETWMEKVLRQLIKMEAAYETDEVVLAIAAEKAQLFQKYGKFGISEVTDRLLQQDLTLSVNVGMGATDPDTRLQRLMQGFGFWSKLIMEGPPNVNPDESFKMIMGLSGFRDALKLLTKVDPRLEQAKKMMAEAESKAKEVVGQAKDRLVAKEMQLNQRENAMERKMLEAQYEFGKQAQELAAKQQLELRSMVFEQQIDAKKAANDMDIERRESENKMAIERREAREKELRDKHAAEVENMIKQHNAHVERLIKEQNAAHDREIEAKKVGGTWQIKSKAKA